MRSVHFLPVLLLLVSGPAAAEAGMFFDVEIRGIYEDNVVGLLSDSTSGNTTQPGAMSARTSAVKAAAGRGGMGQGSGPGGSGGAGAGPGGNAEVGSGTTKNRDTAVDLFADLGGTTAVTRDMDLFLAGSIERIAYSTFTEFSSTTGGLTTGITQRFGPVFSARLAVSGSVKNYDDRDKDASAYLAGAKLKQRVGDLWLLEGYEYEKNHAESSFYSYTGRTAKVSLGYLLLKRTTVLAGYSYLVRRYNEPADFWERAWTTWGGLEWEAFDKWFLVLEYDRRKSDTTVPGTSTTDNIISAGVRYSY
jgi:hypothetical protein